MTRDLGDGPLAFVVQTYLPAIDGTAILIQNLAEQFAANGDQVHVITTDALDPAGFRTRSNERANAAAAEEIRGVHVHRLATRWWLSSLSRPLQALASRARLPGAERLGDLYFGPMMPRLLKTLNGLRPRAVYASAFPFLHMHQLAAWGKRRGLPVVLHGAIHPEERWAFDRSSIRRSCLQAAGYAANTSYEASYVEGLGVPRERISVVGVGIDPDALTAARPVHPGATDHPRPRVLYLAHLTARKGLDTVVEALPAIWLRHPTIEIVVAGRATDETQGLHQAALRVSQGHDLRWLPDITEREKAALLASSSVVLYPARFESFGIVFLEAWTFGVPVVGCGAGAVPDVVEDGVTGLLIPPGDSVALAHSVGRLLDNPAEARRLGAEGRRRVLEHHTWHAVALRAGQALAAARVSATVRRSAR